MDVVVVTHLGGPLLRAGLGALVPQLGPDDRVLVVVSADPGTADVGELPARVELLALGENPKYAAAANRGFAWSRAPWVLLLNDDTHAQPGFLDALRQGAHEPGLYQPRILLADASGRLDNVGHGLFPDGFNWARGREAPDAAAYDQPGTVGACSGAAVLLHRRVLDQLGGFDADLVAFGEDVDLSLRARRAGFPLRYLPDARIAHHLGASYGRYGPDKIYLVERNRVRLAARSLPWTAVASMPVWTAVRLAGLGLSGAAGRGWAARVPAGAKRAALRGVRDGVLSLPDALRKRRADAQGWRVSDAQMWGHLWRERVRVRDLVR
jgi:GT2 family glycosyltransferase